MIKDHSRRRMTETNLLIKNRAIQPYAVIAGIQTYIDYLHENLCFFPPEGRLNFGMGDVAGLTQVCNNYATMLQIPQVTPSPVSPYDADADAWFEAVRLANIAAGASASLAAISTPNKVVMNNLFLTLKAQNVWAAAQQSNFFGASPYLAGALVPLNPSFATVTNNNFVEADYSRTSGLLGDGTSKYIKTNFLPSAANQDNLHLQAYITQGASLTTRIFLGNTVIATSGGFYANIATAASGTAVTTKCLGASSTNGTLGRATGLASINRSVTATYDRYLCGNTVGVTSVGSAPVIAAFTVFAGSTGQSGTYNNARIGFYSIGSSIATTATYLSNALAVETALATTFSSLT